MPAITEPYYHELNDSLSAIDATLSVHLRLAERREREDLLKLITGVSVMLQMSGTQPDIDQINAVLRQRLGSGHSWFSCLQFLSGARARETFAQREALLRDLLEPAFVEMTRLLLPDMPKLVADMLATTPAGQAAQAVRDAKARVQTAGEGG
ncbi:hypothetical protein [Cupriavidus sp. TMH.W2]|uniref:hypothetical protein n=1 Tax=Cupriavidus sp. TMH.W2 TaxID=3434465 RepID=UPI003D78A1F2